jgi:hypothetical protein
VDRGEHQIWDTVFTWVQRGFGWLLCWQVPAGHARSLFSDA